MRRHPALPVALAAALLPCAPLATARAQPGPADPPPVALAPVALGLPPVWMPYVSGTAVLGRPGARAGASATAGVYRSVLGNPVAGLLGASAEAYGTAGGGVRPAGGLRLLAVTRALNLGAGLDWDTRSRTSTAVVSWNTATRRGGVLGDGSTLRVDWVPARGHTLGVGLTLPLAQPRAGRTRRVATGVTLPEPVRVPDDRAVALGEAAERALAGVDECVRLIATYANFFGDGDESSREGPLRDFRRSVLAQRDSIARRSPRFPDGRGYPAVQRAYAAALAAALGAAAGEPAPGGPLGAALAARARAGLLDDVLLPYDTLFGQVKNRQRDLGGFTSRARAGFARWLDDSSGVAPERRPAVRAAHARWIAAVDRAHDGLVDRWDDSRRVWLPLQLALAPEDHDEAAEVDALVARAVGRPFADGNAVAYRSSFDLQAEFARGVGAARDYHVLWLHDVAGRDAAGRVDGVTFAQVADVYLPALAAAVRRYDALGRLPAYLLFLDQYYFEENASRPWLALLADPLGAARPRLRDPALDARLGARLAELRAAVAASPGLRADAERAAGRAGAERWLRRRVRVHVSVTQPSDFTFRSHRIVPPIPFLPDNLMRDHRKLAFYDLTAADPYRGALVVAGVGIGAQYASPTWDDRGLVVRGPAAVEARAAALRLLRYNGVAEADLPAVLRDPPPAAPPTPAGRAPAPPPAAPAPPDTTAYGARALQVHNEPGFGRKQSSVARAMLYALAPRGTTIVVPDPLWLGFGWAGMLTGAALRGCRVYVIAPAAANSPVDEAPALTRAYDVLVRLVEIQRTLGPAIRAAGGDLRVGLYAATEDVNDVAATARAAHAGLDAAPWLRARFPFDSATVRVLDRVPRLLAERGYAPVALARDARPRPPQLHRKTQFLADSAALARLASRPEWPEVLEATLLERARRTETLPRLDSAALAGGAPPRTQPRDALLRAFDAERPAAERARPSFYLAVGSQNHDPRGAMLDGEATVLVAGPSAAVALVDTYVLMARSTWVADRAALDRLLTPRDSWANRFMRYLRFLL